MMVHAAAHTRVHTCEHTHSVPERSCVRTTTHMPFRRPALVMLVVLVLGVQTQSWFSSAVCRCHLCSPRTTGGHAARITRTRIHGGCTWAPDAGALQVVAIARCNPGLMLDFRPNCLTTGQNGGTYCGDRRLCFLVFFFKGTTRKPRTPHVTRGPRYSGNRGKSAVSGRKAVCLRRTSQMLGQ